MIFARQVGQGRAVGFTNGRADAVGNFAFFVIRFVLDQRRTDGILHLFERLGVGGLLFEDLDDVKAVLRLDQVGNGAGRQGERSFLKFGYGLTVNEPAQIAAFFFAAGIFRIFFGEFVELAAFFGLFEDVFGLFPDFVHFGVGF